MWMPIFIRRGRGRCCEALAAHTQAEPPAPPQDVSNLQSWWDRRFRLSKSGASMKIAVTGATGFIGSRLMASLGKDARAVSLRGNLKELAGVDAVVHLAGEAVSQRWTKEVR
jgi:hypothetical protein